MKTILDKDPEANVLVAGDYNEFVQTRSVFASLNGVLQEIDEVAGVPPVERYTYVFDQNNEQLDHAFISQALSEREVQVQHVHVSLDVPKFLYISDVLCRSIIGPHRSPFEQATMIRLLERFTSAKNSSGICRLLQLFLNMLHAVFLNLKCDRQETQVSS